MLKYQLLTPPNSNICHIKEGGKLVSSPLGGAAGIEIFIIPNGSRLLPRTISMSVFFFLRSSLY